MKQCDRSNQTYWACSTLTSCTYYLFYSSLLLFFMDSRAQMTEDLNENGVRRSPLGWRHSQFFARAFLSQKKKSCALYYPWRKNNDCWKSASTLMWYCLLCCTLGSILNLSSSTFLRCFFNVMQDGSSLWDCQWSPKFDYSTNVLFKFCLFFNMHFAKKFTYLRDFLVVSNLKIRS